MKLKIVNPVKELAAYGAHSKATMVSAGVILIGFILTIFVEKDFFGIVVIMVFPIFCRALLFEHYSLKETCLSIILVILLGTALLLKAVIPVRVIEPGIRVRISPKENS